MSLLGGFVHQSYVLTRSSLVKDVEPEFSTMLNDAREAQHGASFNGLRVEGLEVCNIGLPDYGGPSFLRIIDGSF